MFYGLFRRENKNSSLNTTFLSHTRTARKHNIRQLKFENIARETVFTEQIIRHRKAKCTAVQTLKSPQNNNFWSVSQFIISFLRRVALIYLHAKIFAFTWLRVGHNLLPFHYHKLSVNSSPHCTLHQREAIATLNIFFLIAPHLPLKDPSSFPLFQVSTRQLSSERNITLLFLSTPIILFPLFFPRGLLNLSSFSVKFKKKKNLKLSVFIKAF